MSLVPGGTEPLRGVRRAAGSSGAASTDPEALEPAPAPRGVAGLATLVSATASPLARRVATGAFWSICGSVFSRALGVAAAILVARHLRPASFGEYSLVLTSAGVFQAFAAFGLGATVTKYLSGNYRSDAPASGRVIALSWLVAAAMGTLAAVILALAAPWIASGLLDAPQLAAPLRVGSLLLLFGSMNSPLLGVLTGLERFRLVALVSAVSGAASIPLLVLGALHGGVPGAVAGMVASAAVTTALYAAAVRVATRASGIRPVYRGALREWRILFSYSLPATLSDLLLAPIAWVTSVIIANQASGLHELGLFSAANQWRNALWLVATATGNVLFPLFSNLHQSRRPRTFSRAFWLSFASMGVMCLAAAGVLSAMAPVIMRAYGPEFGDATTVLILLVVAGAISAPLNVAGHALAGAGRMWVAFGLQSLWACGLLATTFALRSRGAVGLSIAHVVACLIHLVTSVGCAHLLVLRRARREELHVG